MEKAISEVSDGTNCHDISNEEEVFSSDFERYNEEKTEFVVQTLEGMITISTTKREMEELMNTLRHPANNNDS